EPDTPGPEGAQGPPPARLRVAHDAPCRTRRRVGGIRL
ncbi:MAG: hypothetical protein AVDCRST_MAG79-1459, partial [uncultured Thermoleophilia bacterium]